MYVTPPFPITHPFPQNLSSSSQTNTSNTSPVSSTGYDLPLSSFQTFYPPANYLSPYSNNSQQYFQYPPPGFNSLFNTAPSTAEGK